MEFIKNKLNVSVPIGARIFAGLLLIVNGISLGSLLLIMNRPDILREPIDGTILLTEAEIQVLIAAAPIGVAITVVVVLGLFLIIFKKAWGFFLYALPLLFSGIVNLIAGDVNEIGSSLIQVVIMALLIFIVKPRPKLETIQQDPSNYKYHVTTSEPSEKE